MARVDVVIPSYKGIHPEAQSSLIKLLQETKGKHSVWIPPQANGSSVVHWSRNQAITLALYGVDNGLSPAEYLFLMDDDMLCGPRDLLRLLSYKTDIVSGIATVRRDPPRPNIRFWDEKIRGYGTVHEWDWDSNRLMEVDAVGAAYMLVKREVFEKMGRAYLDCFFERAEDKRKYPRGAEDIDAYWNERAKRRHLLFAGATAQGADWKLADCWWFQFLDNIVDDQQGELGEDLAFCWKAKQLGYKIYVDPQVLPGHIGNYGYSVADYRDFVNGQKTIGAWQAPEPIPAG